MNPYCGWISVLAILLAVLLGSCQTCRSLPKLGRASLETERLAMARLAAAAPDSDVAVILTEALQGASALPERSAAILEEGLAKAMKAAAFKIIEEAPLPAGWPSPSLTGLVRIKAYPGVRAARVKSGGDNDQFMALFRHIEAKRIPMSAPVVMDYPAAAGTSTAKQMAFLYAEASKGPTGTFDKVEVVDDAPLIVISVGIQGSYSQSNAKKAAAQLRQWLKGHPEWREAGPVRVLAYNSPFHFPWNKYSEVQIPMKANAPQTPAPAGKSEPQNVQKMPPLTPVEAAVIEHKGTERPFSGQHWNRFEAGTYACRKCGAELYRSAAKFPSDCGWPSFDDEIPGAVKRLADADGERTEIVCASCGGHLGHLFLGEGFTAKDTRHCVNSVSLVFRPAASGLDTAYFAGGCFWGVEDAFQQEKGVKTAISGYMGGTVANPSYDQVCSGRTGHAETVKVEFDPSQVSYATLARLFFELHDPTQLNRQGPDVGSQYRSAVFYASEAQKQVAEKLIAELLARGYAVVTEVVPAGVFYPAEAYHQDYLEHHPERAGCHLRVKRFEIGPI